MQERKAQTGLAAQARARMNSPPYAPLTEQKKHFRFENHPANLNPDRTKRLTIQTKPNFQYAT
jgi:hypothetical protein